MNKKWVTEQEVHYASPNFPFPVPLILYILISLCSLFFHCESMSIKEEWFPAQKWDVSKGLWYQQRHRHFIWELCCWAVTIWRELPSSHYLASSCQRALYSLFLEVAYSFIGSMKLSWMPTFLTYLQLNLQRYWLYLCSYLQIFSLLE